MKRNLICDKSFNFAVRIINLEKHLRTIKKEYTISKQIVRSGTSIGANIKEGTNAESKKDFIHKLSISLKECSETIYWIDLLLETKYISEKEYKGLIKDATEIIKILTAIIKSSKTNV